MPRLAGAAVLALGLLVAACSGPAGLSAGASSTPARSQGQLSGRITVFAASSLTEAFRAIAVTFRQAHPGVTVDFNFAASSTLAAQLDQGARADVFASADAATMQRSVERGLIDGEPAAFARGRPVIVVPADNRAGTSTPRDLARPGTRIVLAGPQVPIGNYARQVIDNLAADPAYGAAFKEAVLRNVVSDETSVRAVLTKVELGEADAGIVYATDARVAGDRVKVLPIPPAANVTAAYPIAVVRGARHADGAHAFIEFVRGAEGRRILAEAGFDAAP